VNARAPLFPASLLAVVLLLPSGAGAQKVVTEVPVLNPGMGTGVVGSGVSLGGAGLGKQGGGLDLSAPTLTGTHLPPAVSPSPVIAGPAASKVRAAVRPQADAVAPEVGSEATRKNLQVIGEKTRKIQGIIADEGKSPRAGEKASAVGSTVFDGGIAGKASPVSVGGIGVSQHSGLQPSRSGFSVREVRRTGTSRRQGWTADGRPAEYLDGGGFKDVLIHPASPEHLLTLFNQSARNDSSRSRTERDREMDRRVKPGKLGLTPKVVLSGALREVKEKSGTRTVHYLVQERVRGHMLERGTEADLVMVQALFQKLIQARLKIEDEVKLFDNIMIGATKSAPKKQAWVVDAGELEAVKPRSLIDKLLDRPDPLAAHYKKLYQRIAAKLR